MIRISLHGQQGAGFSLAPFGYWEVEHGVCNSSNLTGYFVGFTLTHRDWVHDN